MIEPLEAVLGRSSAPHTDIRFHRLHRVRYVLRDDRVELVTSGTTCGGVARCLHAGSGWGVASFGALTEAGEAVDRASELSRLLPSRHPPVLAPARECRAAFPCPPESDLRGDGSAVVGRFASSLSDTLRGADRRVCEVRVRGEFTLEEIWLATSEGIRLQWERPELTLAALVVVSEQGSEECASDSIASPGDRDAVERWMMEAPRIVERAVSRLHAVPLPAARRPVVLDPGMAGLWVHRAVVHRCLAGASREEAGALEAGIRLGPEGVTIGDDGTASGLRGTLAFDAEGTAPGNTILVRKGVVLQRLETRSSAGASGVAATGNGRAECRATPTARPTNSYLANGEGGLEELLRPVEEGVYLAHPDSALLEQGRIVIRAAEARMIRGGELAEAVKGAALVGDAVGLFGLVDQVGGDFRWDHSASLCEQSGAHPVPVSVGAPHVRLVEVPIGEAA